MHRLTAWELIEKLASKHLLGWWMARDASAELLTKQPQHCLAHWLAASADELIDAMAETKLFQNGSSPAAREKRVGVPIATARVKLGGAHINFIWLGEPPEGSLEASIKEQLAGNSGTCTLKVMRGMPSCSPMEMMKRVEASIPDYPEFERKRKERNRWPSGPVLLELLQLHHRAPLGHPLHHRGLSGWWLARDADDALLEAHPRSCLAVPGRVAGRD